MSIIYSMYALPYIVVKLGLLYSENPIYTRKDIIPNIESQYQMGSILKHRNVEHSNKIIFSLEFTKISCGL